MTWMCQRLIPLVLALVIGASPISRAVCQVACAEHHQAAAHHHHHSSATAHDDRMAMGHCTHAEAPLTASTPIAKIAFAEPAVVPQFIEGADLNTLRLWPGSHDVSRPPIPISLRTPLRV